MPIEEYFQTIQTAISTCSAIASFTLDCDKRDTYEGFIRGEIKFIDRSVLSIREFVSVETAIERDMNAYQYMDEQNTLIFRYDNTLIISLFQSKCNNHPSPRHSERQGNRIR